MRDRPRRVTLRDVALESGLSTAAVSYALRGLQVPVETQRRVRDVAERLGYQVDPIARALVSGRTGYVGVLCGSLQDTWQQDVAAALGRELLDAGRHALIVDAASRPDLESELAGQLLAQRVDALIALWVDTQAPHWRQVARRVPLVSIGDSMLGAATAAEFVFDNEQGVGRALGRLADAGHRRVGVLTPASRNAPDHPAELALRQVAEALGIRVDLHLCAYEVDAAEQVAARVLAERRPPTALFCLADSMAFGVYAAAARLGRRIPEDLSVLGYDDHPASRLLSPPLSTFSWPVQPLVESAVERTVRAIEDDRRWRRTTLSPTERSRGSVGRVPARRLSPAKA